MKPKTKIVLIAVIIIFIMDQSFSIPLDKSSYEGKETIIEQNISEAISYPDFAKSSGLEGFVLVQYHINQFGKIKVDAINGSDNKLMNYVYNQLSELNVTSEASKYQFARFVFKLY